jgi:hypothetical protein
MPSSILHRPSSHLVFLLTHPALAADDPKKPADQNNNQALLYHTTFSTPDSLKQLTFTDKSAWTLIEDDVEGAKRQVLSLTKQSDYKPPVRSPINQAWINDLKLTHFILEVKCKIAPPKIPHRDLCFLFAGVDPSHFLYAHVAQEEDRIHNQIHLVDGKDRAPVTLKRSPGAPWDDKYHTIKLTRDDKQTSVYFDNELLMTTDRKDLPAGKLGFGSFDDTGNFAEVTIWGKRAE